MESSRIWYLKRIHLFRRLSEEELERVQEVAGLRVVQRRQLILGPEDPGDAIHVIEKGRVKLSRFDDGGREITIAILEDGELFGEEALAGDERREGFAEALDETRILRIERTEFERLLESNSDLALTVARQVCERLLGDRSRLEALAFRDASARLAGALLELARRHGEPAAEDAVRIAQSLTHQELAGLIACTRETAVALLNDFRREGWIRAEGRALLVVDRPALERLARDR